MSSDPVHLPQLGRAPSQQSIAPPYPSHSRHMTPSQPVKFYNQSEYSGGKCQCEDRVRALERMYQQMMDRQQNISDRVDRQMGSVDQRIDSQSRSLSVLRTDLETEFKTDMGQKFHRFETYLREEQRSRQAELGEVVRQVRIKLEEVRSSLDNEVS